ncbi:MAG: chain length determinant protein EpsF [Burkholderiaceae bacterium]
MKFGQFLQVIRSRWVLVLFLFALTTGAALVTSLMLPKSYTASATLYVDTKSFDPVLGGAVIPSASLGSTLATQANIILSDRVTFRVVKNLGLDSEPGMVARWREKTGGIGDIRKWIAESLLVSLEVAPSREASTIEITFTSGDPNFSAAVVNNFAKAYVDTTLELRVEPAKSYQSQFATQTKSYREQVEAAQSKLSAFQQKSGITATDERFDVENSRLQELSNQLVMAQAQLADARSKRSALSSGNETLGEILQNPLIQSMKSEILKAEAKVQDLRSRLGPNHPQMISAEAELRGLRGRLNGEISRLASSVVTSSRVQQRREGELRAALEAQRQKVLKLKKERDQLAVLQREVDSAQKALDLVTQRLTQTSLETQTRQSNVSVLSPATPPSTPTSPKPKLNTVIGALAGLVLGILSALVLESVHKPLRSSEDMLDAVGVPILAVLPRADSRRALRLIGDTGPTLPTGGPLRLEN